MNATLKRLADERDAQVSFIEQLLASVEAESRDLVDAETANIKAAQDRIAEIDAQMAPLAAFEERRASAVKVVEMTAPPTHVVSGRAPARTEPVGEQRSIGDIFVESEQFRAYPGRGSSEVITIPEFRAVGPDPLLTTTVPGSDLLPNPYKFRGPEHFEQFPLLSLVSRVEVSSNSVEIVVTTDAAGADVVAEGAKKPPVVWTTHTRNLTLQTIAGWFKYSRQAAEDIPQLRDLVNSKIRRAIDVKLNGLATTALGSAITAGNTTTGASKQPMLEVIRIAMGELQARGIAPGAIAVNPADHASLDIALLAGSLGGATRYSSYFGIPVVSLPGLTAGEAIVGDISNALTWFYRTGLQMYVTDSDVSDTGTAGAAESDFRKNILTALGEVRGVFGVVDAQAIQKAKITP